MGVRIPPRLPDCENREGMEFLKRVKEFFEEVAGEFRRVNWPSRQDVAASTAVVLVVVFVLVEMELTDETWHLVRSTPKVTGFVGSGSKPVALPPEEVEGILRQMEEGAEKPKLKSTFQKGDKVRVIEGPFVNFQGAIDDLNPERGKLKVMVAIFGRLTPVELEYYQVERL